MKEKIKMNLKKIFSFGLILCCLLGHTGAMENVNDNSDALKTFKCPTIQEIHECAIEMKKSKVWGPYLATRFTLTTKEGVIFQPLLDPWDKNINTVQRALNLTQYNDTCLIEKDGLLKKLLFRYSPKIGQTLTLELDLKSVRINPENASYSTDVSPERISTSIDGTKYISFNDPNLMFTILPIIKTFRCPTINEIHTHAKEIKALRNYTEQSFTLTTNQGVVFKARSSNVNFNAVQRALNIKSFKSVSIIKKGASKQNDENFGGGYITKVLIWYTADTAQDFALKLDLEAMGIDPGNIFCSIPASSEYTSYYRDDEQYIHFDNPNIEFTLKLNSLLINKKTLVILFFDS
jgi:hypothetical protein